MVIDMPVLGERWTGRAGASTLYSDGIGAERLCRTRDGLRLARTRRFGGDCHIDLVIEGAAG
ncbi:hypothetical protein [Azospirillum brasilense]|uniref:Uncharacterized protein n=1 Tax=Azospirillum brasilense TaxID=192 RepID=A0A235HGE9_AZOBR|nr:hypothetical protein [Azospirillum brasilense]OYD84889.1 hypothetical protein CHT98_08275 [Azospirillum brasilense]